MYDPVTCLILGTLTLIGSVVGVIASTAVKCKFRTAVLDVASGALATLAIGVPAMSFAVAQGIDLGSTTPVVGSSGTWLLSLGAYLSGALIALSIGRLVQLRVR